jgi:maltooligosyltrehalose synthase
MVWTTHVIKYINKIRIFIHLFLSLSSVYPLIACVQDHVDTWLHSLDTPHTVGLLWTIDPPVADTSTWQDTTLTRDIHAYAGFLTQNTSKREAVDLALEEAATRIGVYLLET